MTERNIRSRLFGVNIPRNERIATALGGAAAVAFGLSRGLGHRSIGGALLAVVGAAAIARAASGRCPAYRARAARKGIQLRRAITVQASPREVYELWRDFPRLPRFMKHISEVTASRGNRSHWVAQVGRKELAWDVELVEDLAPRRLRWRALPGGDVRHEGTVDIHEAAGDRGTIVEVKLHWFPPGGLLVAAPFYSLLRRLAAAELGQDLARFQQLIETGEISTGARRIDEMLDDDIAIAQVAPGAASPSPATTAETSTWPMQTPTTLPGGVR